MRRVVGKISDSLPCFTTVVSHVGCCDDLLPSPLLFLHVVYKWVTSLYSTVVKRDTCLLFFLVFIHAL